MQIVILVTIVEAGLLSIELSAIRAVATELERTSALAGTPHPVIDFQDCPAIVHSFYCIWCELPWFTENRIGSGLYVLSVAALARLGAFADVTNDDQYVHDLFKIYERVSVKWQQLVVRLPRTLRGSIRRRTRTYARQQELDQRFGLLPGRASRFSVAELLCRKPKRIFDIPIFIGVSITAKRAAIRKALREGRRWERDETSRTMAGR